MNSFRSISRISKSSVAGIEALTNNKIGYSTPILDTDISVAKDMFDVNVFALIAVTQAFAPLLIAAKGTIVNIGSIAGKFQTPWQGNYNASKAAVNLLTDQLRVELRPFDVKAINVITGAIKTKFFNNQPSVKISPGSLYYPAREEIEAIGQGSLVEKDGTDVDVYAEAVAANALKKNPTMNQWTGSQSFLIWFAGAFLPHSFWVNFASNFIIFYSRLKDFADIVQDLAISLPGPFKMPLITKKIKEADRLK